MQRALKAFFKTTTQELIDSRSQGLSEGAEAFLKEDSGCWGKALGMLNPLSKGAWAHILDQWTLS